MPTRPMRNWIGFCLVKNECRSPGAGPSPLWRVGRKVGMVQRPVGRFDPGRPRPLQAPQTVGTDFQIKVALAVHVGPKLPASGDGLIAEGAGEDRFMDACHALGIAGLGTRAENLLHCLRSPGAGPLHIMFGN
jgi:hypothetical protein